MIATRAAWLGKEEVVEVLFDPAVTPYEKVLAESQCVEKPATVFAHDEAQLAAARKLVGARARPRGSAEAQARDAKRSDRKYYLRQSSYHYLPLTPLQELRINAALGKKEDPQALLSPAQRRLHARIHAARQRAKGKAWDLQPARSGEAWAAYLRELERRL